MRTVARIIDSKESNLVGHKIREYRKMRKMSQQELSAKLETYAVYVCRGSISRIEEKQRTVTDIELNGFAKALSVTIADLFEEEEQGAGPLRKE